MKEIWKDIEDYEGIYKVSNLGRVKSLDRYVNNPHGIRIQRGRILKQNEKKFKKVYKRPEVALCNNGSCRTKIVSRLVAYAFVPNLLNKPHVNHIDNNPLNNNFKNLEWCTPQENTIHSCLYGNKKYYEECDREKIINDYLNGNKGIVVAKMNNVTTSVVYGVLIKNNIPRRDKYEQRNIHNVDRKGIRKAYNLGLTNKELEIKFDLSNRLINAEIQNYKRTVEYKQMRGIR